jgi:hypothetical protein
VVVSAVVVSSVVVSAVEVSDVVVCAVVVCSGVLTVVVSDGYPVVSEICSPPQEASIAVSIAITRKSAIVFFIMYEPPYIFYDTIVNPIDFFVNRRENLQFF